MTSYQRGPIDEGRLLTIDEAPSAQPIKLSGWVGARHPLHGSSSGKILLAGLSEQRRAAILDAGLPAVAPRTMTDRGQLLHELERALPATQPGGVGRGLDVGGRAGAGPHGGGGGGDQRGPSFRFTGRHLDDCIARV